MTGTLFALVCVLVAASATGLAWLAADVVRKASQRYQAEYVARSIDDLSAMFLFLEPRQVLTLNVTALALFAAAGAWSGGPICSALAAVAGFFAPAGAVLFYRKRRLARFEAQLAEALQQIAGALRAGLTLAQALDRTGREADAPLRQEFGLSCKEMKLGVPLEEALGNMAARVGSEDLDLMATSTAIAKQLGGNLAEMFETIAGTVRERFRLEGKVKALTSQGKLQGLIVGSLPLFIGLFFSRFRPDLTAPMFESAYGYVLVLAVVVLEAVGFLLIRRIVAIDP
jgi:tight adherence protein B